MAALRAFKAESDVKQQGVPKSPADYKITLDGLDVPKDMKINFNENDPALKATREWAQKNNLSQQAFNDLLKVEAGREIARQTQFKTDIAAERTKLGENASARLEAVTNALKGRLGDLSKPLIAGLISAEQVEAYENLLRSAITPPPGTMAPPNTKPDFSKMSTVEKLHFARSNNQRKTA